MISGKSRLPACSSARLPAGLLSRDYLKFFQLSVDDELTGKVCLEITALREAMAAIKSGSMIAARPAMKVFFDGYRFWLANYFYRYEAARRLGAWNQEFWCDIEAGSKECARRYA